jgi:hypothetical protein
VLAAASLHAQRRGNGYGHPGPPDDADRI